MNRSSAVTVASATAGDETRSAHVQRDRHPRYATILGHPWRIRQQPNAQVFSGNWSHRGWFGECVVSVAVQHSLDPGFTDYGMARPVFASCGSPLQHGGKEEQR